MAHGNNFLATGYGSTRQWLAPFQLIDDTGTVMFAVAADGTLTTSASLINASVPYTFASTLNVNGLLTAAGYTSTGTASKLDLSATTAANAAIKFTETSDTPTVAFTDNGTAAHAPTTAPHGYLKVLVGATPLYIPCWA